MNRLATRIAVVGLAISGLLLGVGVQRAEAHFRDFSFLRDWHLPYRGEKEMEYRLFHLNRGNELGHEFEFEYGITDHFAFEPGLSWHQMDDEKLHLDGFDGEFRFNFGDYKVDTPLFALNLEYEHPFDKEEADHAEAKFVVSYFTKKDEDLTVNLNIGQQLSKEREKESEIGLGYMRPIIAKGKTGHGYNTGLRAGFESTFDFQEHFANAGPTLVFSSGEHFNIVAHIDFALNKKHENTDGFRLVAEWEW